MGKMLAYDFGASSGRGIIGEINNDMLKLREVHRFSNDPVIFSDYLQWDILRLCHEVKQGILKCKNAGEDIASIGIDTWGVDFGLLDSRGELLKNPYHYRDKRTDGMIEECLKYIDKKELYKRTGIQSAKYNTIYQLLAMKTLEDKSLDEASTLLMMPDLINYMLSGEMVSEYTECTTSQLYSHNLNDWDTYIIDKLNIPQTIFTKIVKPATVIGNIRKSICEELNVSPALVVAVASHDTASAISAVPSEGEDHVYISCGTWSLLGIETDQPITCDKAFEYNFTNEGGIDNKITFLKNIMGLWIVQECKRHWEKEGHNIGFSELVKMAQSEKECVSFIDPDNLLFYAPNNMPSKVRQFCMDTNQPVPETYGQIIRCIEESLAYKYRWAIEKIEEITSKKINTIHMVGGGIQDQLLCQLTANATCRKVIAGPVEATAAGNILAQAMVLGKVKSIAHGREIIRNSFDLKTYLPQDTNIYDKGYQKFLKILSLK